MMLRRDFTGRHMLAVMIAFFGVVIAVNVVMATLAAKTFSGTVVDNSYVASQQFNRWLAEGRAQERLGWNARLAVGDDRHVQVALSDRTGPIDGAEVHAIARHPLGRAQDLAFSFRASGAGVYVSDRPLPVGRWHVSFEMRRGADELRLMGTLS